MRPLRLTRLVLALAALTALAGAAVAAADTGSSERGGGVELAVPQGWSRVEPAAQDATIDPRTVLVVGTDGVHAIESDCQVSAYHVPADGAVVVVIRWRETTGSVGFLPLSAMKLRRGTFECFVGRGAVAQVTRRGRDYQVNVMVGDDVTAKDAADALDVARSIVSVRRRQG